MAKVYQQFIAGEFPSQNIIFYYKTGKMILQHLKGDFSLANNTVNLAELSEMHVPTDRIVELTTKIFEMSSALSQ